MNRMNLDQLVKFFQNKDMNGSANYFESYRQDESSVVDGWIDAEHVHDYVSAICAVSGAKVSWKEIQSNVTTAIGCGMKFRVSDRNDIGIHGEVYDSNGKYVKSMNIPYKEWASKYGGIPFHEAYLRRFDLK